MNNMETLTFILIVACFIKATKIILSKKYQMKIREREREDAILRKEAIRIKRKQEELERKYIETLIAESPKKLEENQK